MKDASIGLGAKLALALGAGLVGATVMLLSQKTEMWATGRGPSMVPAKAAETLTGVTLYDPADEARLSTAAHFAFGTTLGLGVALLDRAPAAARAPLFAAGAWGAGNAIMTALGACEPPTRWSRQALAIDLLHHAVYGAATAGAYAEATRLIEARSARG
ncbi:hypothetical protein [Sphingomonas sp.]|uniref:hypothetical protein n=1 Tax=Sphingomonas sp. TaxID=28214 RepID=UPI003B008180